MFKDKKGFFFKLLIVFGLLFNFCLCKDEEQWPPIGEEGMPNIADTPYDTCESLNTTGLFLNADPNLKLNIEGQITVLFRILPFVWYQNQIGRIHQLKNRFDEYGFNAIQFVIVIPHVNAAPKVRQRILAELENISNDIDVIHETESSKPVLQMGYNQAYIVDHCGRLSYIIVPPWSHIEFPYIKAAILSTIYDTPCGACETPYLLQPHPGYTPDIEFVDISTESSTETTEASGEEETTTSTETQPASTPFYNQIEEIVDQDDKIYMAPVEDNLRQLNTSDNTSEFVVDNNESSADFTIPLRIILPVEHVHHDPIKDSYKKYNYIVLNTDDKTFHEHVGAEEEVQRVEDVTEYTRHHDLVNEIEGGNELFVNKAGVLYQLLKEYQIENAIEFKEVEMLETDIVRDAPTITQLDTADYRQAVMRKHYDQLIQWLTWQFDQ